MTITQEMLDAQAAVLAALNIFMDLDAEIEAELQAAEAKLAEAQAALDNGEYELAAQKLAESLQHTENAVRLIRKLIGG